MAALGRAVAPAERDGPDAGVTAIDAIPARERLRSTPFLAAALGELELKRGRPEVARAHFQEARARARNEAERRHLARRLASCRT